MANRDDHDLAGTVLGALTTLIASKPQNAGEALLAIVSGGLVGRIASALPDALEPATHPGHRKTAHSLTAAATVAATTLRNRPAPLHLQPAGAAAAPVPAPELPFGDRLVRAWVPAAGAGYISHLVLDAGTPKGLPFI